MISLPLKVRVRMGPGVEIRDATDLVVAVSDDSRLADALVDAANSAEEACNAASNAKDEVDEVKGDLKSAQEENRKLQTQVDEYEAMLEEAGLLTKKEVTQKKAAKLDLKLVTKEADPSRKVER